MRANIMLYTRLLQEYDLLKMKAAYIAAEREIISDSSLTNWQDMDNHFMMGQAPIDVAELGITISPEAFHEMHKPVSGNDSKIRTIEAQMKDLEDTGQRLLDEERYELMQEAKEIWEQLKRDLDKLKNK